MLSRVESIFFSSIGYRLVRNIYKLSPSRVLKTFMCIPHNANVIKIWEILSKQHISNLDAYNLDFECIQIED